MSQKFTAFIRLDLYRNKYVRAAMQMDQINHGSYFVHTNTSLRTCLPSCFIKDVPPYGDMSLRKTDICCLSRMCIISGCLRLATLNEAAHKCRIILTFRVLKLPSTHLIHVITSIHQGRRQTIGLKHGTPCMAHVGKNMGSLHRN